MTLLFGDYLNEKRKERNYSIRRLALRSSVNHSTISRLERHLCRPSLTTLKKLAAGLNLPPQELYFAAGYIDHPYVEIDVAGLPNEDVNLIDGKFNKLNKKVAQNKKMSP